MNDHVIAEIAICPLGTESPEVSSYIRKCVDIVKKAAEKGIKYELSSMGTTIEGPLPLIFEIVMEMNEATFAEGAKRVYTVVKNRRPAR